MRNRWSDSARAASAAARLGKYGPMMGLQPWGDSARAAAAAARAERAALAGGMTSDEAVDIAMDARYGSGYLSEGSDGIDPTLGIGRVSSGGGRRSLPTISDAAPYEARQAAYEKAFREWWSGVQATEQNIAGFHAFVAAFAGAAAGGMGAYRQATGENPVAGASRAFGRAGSYLSGKTPMYDGSGVLAGWARPGASRYGGSPRSPVRQPLSKAANLRFDLGRAKVMDPSTGKVSGRVPYSAEDFFPSTSRDMGGVQKAYDLGVRSYPGGLSFDQALSEAGIVAGSQEAYLFEKGWNDSTAVMDAAENFEPYSVVPETAESVLADFGPQAVYDYGTGAYRDGVSLEAALNEAGIRPGTEAAYSVEKGYNDAAAVEDPYEADGAVAESLGEEYEAYLDAANAARVAELGAKGLDPLGFPLAGGYDPISEREAEGREAFANGESLQEAFRERGLDPDNDADMAFVLGYKDARKEAASNAGDVGGVPRYLEHDPAEVAPAGTENPDAFVAGMYDRDLGRGSDAASLGIEAGSVAEADYEAGYSSAMVNPGVDVPAGFARETAAAYRSGRSWKAEDDAFNELALMREPEYDKARFGLRKDQYGRAMAVQRKILELGRREGDTEDQAEARESLSAAFGAIARGEDASPFLDLAEAIATDLESVPPFKVVAPGVIGARDMRPYVMDLPGGGGFDNPASELPDGAGLAEITPEQREAARALGVLEGEWGVNGMVERMIPPQLLEEYDSGLAEGRKDPGAVPPATPADRAAVIRAARLYLDGKIGDTEEEGSEIPDHLNDRWNVGMYGNADDWASRNKDGIKKGLPDERGQYADAALVKAGLDWLGNAVAGGDTAAADAAVAYLADLLGGVKEDKRTAGRVASDDDDDGEGADDRVEFDEEGEEIEGERFFEDSYADPDMPAPWESGDNGSFRRWFPGVRNRSGVAGRLVSVDAYRERGLRNAWSDAARAASAMVRLAKYGAMMGLQPWGDAARAAAELARQQNGGGGGSGDAVPTSGGKGGPDGGGYGSSRPVGGGSRRTSGGGGSKKEGGGSRRSGGGRGRRSSPKSGGKALPPRTVDFAEAVEAYTEGGIGAMTDDQRKALFEDIKEREAAGFELTGADKGFLDAFEKFLDQALGGKVAVSPESMADAFRKKYGRDPETDSEWAEAEDLAGVPAGQRGHGDPEPAAVGGVEAAAAAFKKKYGREPETDSDWAEAEDLAGVPAGQRGNGEPEPAGAAGPEGAAGKAGADGAPATDGKKLREEGLRKFMEQTGRAPVTGDDYDRVDILGGVPKEQWWDTALNDDNAPADAGIGREKAKAAVAAGDAARAAKAAGRKAGVPGGKPPAHWGEAAKRRFEERQEDAYEQAAREERGAKLAAERAALRKGREDLFTPDWVAKTFTSLGGSRVKDSGSARAARLAEERRVRREERRKKATADWLEEGMPKAKGGVRDGLPPSWDTRVASGSSVGFRVPGDPGMFYLGGGRYVDASGRVVKGPVPSSAATAGGAVFYQGRWIDKKTGRTLKSGVARS